MTALQWDGQLSYRDSLFMSLLGVTDRDERISLILGDIFWRYQCDPLAEERAMSADDAGCLLLGCIASRGVTEERAWGLSERLMSRLPRYELQIVDRLLEAGPKAVERAMSSPTALHRYPREMARNAYRMAQRIQELYGGDARNIWRYPKAVSLDGDGVCEGQELDGESLRKRLMSFHGIGFKISTMACRVLLLDCAVTGISDGIQSLRPSPDVHVQRVAQRLGIVARESSPEEAVSQLLRHAEKTGRPPIEYDAMYLVGREFCHANGPECRIVCPLEEDCLYANYRDPRDLPYT